MWDILLRYGPGKSCLRVSARWCGVGRGLLLLLVGGLIPLLSVVVVVVYGFAGFI